MSNTNSPQPQVEPEEQEFNVRQFFFLYVIRYWYLYVISIVLAVLGAYYYNWYVTPVYEANCTVLVKQGKSGNSNDFLNQIDEYSADRNIQNEIEILRSRSLISKTIQKLNYEISYYLKGNVKTTELYR